MKRTASSLVGGVSPPPLRRKVESTTTKTAVASFFTPASQKKPEKVTWRIVNKSLIVGKYASESKGTDKVHTGKRSRVAAFDFDSTLISTASGNRFARDASDWKWWNNKVPERLKQLNADGYQVIVVSNQKKISLQSEIKGGRTESKSLTTFKEKALVVMRQLDIPLSIYAATQYDEYRKPRTGMWKEFLDDYDLDVDSRLDLEESFFVGDAAGRPTDHSCVDRDFASNAGLKFKTPEEFFLDASPEQAIRQFDPTSYIGDDPDSAVTPTFSKLHPVELVIFCGSPGAGKSTFYWKYLKPLGYERVNQDILKSRQKCIKVAKENLSAGQSVAIDNTNAGTETRAYWTEIAKEFKIPIRCVYFIAPPALCKHNDAVRAANPTLNPESRTALPGIAFGDFARRFQEPQLSEGFEDITRVQFRFDGDEDAKKVWSQFWV
ncbi:putative DNA 3'-phosphatase Tpp1 [Talaromyces proteolyticus]|uniref:DNA 3'-phosphatase Tpp1 n=1 Tax=Talaromyces proteolyticus TaxID=1131652 RepID=A0AAD4KNZ5_9EURO|nr:putative DNA 3'-phosphatase Tpp1 [Talaromyces proteolyticus]KAH8697178.1 putative DNA 3'-phosphatase Tpp1 [Talaromyces proteolyticus]